MKPADHMLELAKARMLSGLLESRWFRSAPESARAVPPKIRVIGVEHRPVRLSEGLIAYDTVQMPFLVGEVTVARIKARVYVRLDFGTGGVIVDEQ